MRSLAAKAAAAARRLHRLLLVLAPRQVRQAYRVEMIETFRAASTEAAHRGVLAVAGLVLREVLDLARSRRANRPHGVVFPPPATVRASSDLTPPSWLPGSAWQQAWRSLVRRPAFTAAAVATLAFGTGITTAVFSLVDTVVIKPLPYPGPDRLVTVYESSPSARERTSLIAPIRLEDWNRLARTFTAISGSYSESVTDTSGADPERLAGLRVAPRYFAVYGMAPLAGRTFAADEERPGGPYAAILSERLWARRFRRDPDALGRALIIGGIPHRIVGVMPSAFTGAATEVWLPARFTPRMLQLREARFLGGIGRLRPGVSVDQGFRDLAAVQEALAREFPPSDAGWSAELRPLKQARIGTARRGLVLIFGAVISLWLIAVANVAGLTLVQVRRRSRELAIRAALGASRMRVIGTVVREGAIVGILGGAAGAALAWLLVSLLPALLPATPRIGELALDGRAAAFAVLTSLLAICIFTLVPAGASTSPERGQALSTGTRTAGQARHRFQHGLVIAQVGLSVLLVGAASLLVRSYYNLTQAESGFDADGAMTFHVGARWDEDRTRVGQLQEQLLARLEQLPHVQAAGMTNFLPAAGATLRYQVRVEGIAGPNQDGSVTVGARMITGGYLRALRARLIAGDWCPPVRLAASRHAMVNQRFVDLYAGGVDVVGRALATQPGSSDTIVGVIGTMMEDGPATSPVPYVYRCASAGGWPDPEYVVRTADPRAFSADLRRIVRELDGERAVFGLRPLREVLDLALEQPRLDAAMVGSFAAAALALAAVGLYSLFMLVVSERAREIAVRLAIGAAPLEMIRMVVAGAGRLLAAGLLLGLVLTAAADRVLRGVLSGVSPLDASALATAVLILSVVALLAVAAPAIKAARVAPLDALRGD